MLLGLPELTSCDIGCPTLLEPCLLSLCCWPLYLSQPGHEPCNIYTGLVEVYKKCNIYRGLVELNIYFKFVTLPCHEERQNKWSYTIFFFKIDLSTLHVCWKVNTLITFTS